jgi:hypothetical protein
MIDKPVHNGDDELGPLGPLVEAIRTDVPDDAQWAAAQQRLTAALDIVPMHSGADISVCPATLGNQGRQEYLPRRALRNRRGWFTAAAVAVALVAVVLWLQFSPLHLGEGAGVRAVAINAQKSHDSPTAHPNPLPAGEGTWIAQVEQTYAVFIRNQKVRNERPLGTGDLLRAGDALRVAPQGGLQVRLDDGSRLWLTANTEAECVGPRSDDSPAWRLTRGEIQADIARGTQKFRIATPGGGLRVLGTEFHVRVYPDDSPRPLAGEGQVASNSPLLPGEGQGGRASGLDTSPNPKPTTNKETIVMSSAANILQRAIVVLTVLSGSVAVETDGQEKVVSKGEQAAYSVAESGSTGTAATKAGAEAGVLSSGGAVVGGNSASSPNKSEAIAGYIVDVGSNAISDPKLDAMQIERLRDWVARRRSSPKASIRPEIMRIVPVYRHLVSGIMAIDVETGKARHLADSVGSPEIVGRIGPDLLLIVERTSHVCLACQSRPWSAREWGSAVALVDVQRGEQMAIPRLDEWKPECLQLSPDEKKLAFVGQNHHGDVHAGSDGVYVMNFETFKPKLVFKFKGLAPTFAAWSPDSRWLAVANSTGYVVEEPEIVLVDTVEGTVKPTGLKGQGVRFSPDGKRLVYSAGFKKGGKNSGTWYRGVLASGNIFMSALSDGSTEQVTHLEKGGAIRPQFSTDGSRMAYVEMPSDGDGERLRIVDLATKKDDVAFGSRSVADFGWLDENGSKLFVAYYDKDMFLGLCADPSSQSAGGVAGHAAEQLTVIERRKDGWAATQLKLQLPSECSPPKSSSQAK